MNGRGSGLGVDGFKSAASISVPSALLYFTISGATIGIDAHRSLKCDTTFASPAGVLIHSSGACVAVSPANAIVPSRFLANDDGFTVNPSTNCGCDVRLTSAMALLNPRATCTA